MIAYRLDMVFQRLGFTVLVILGIILLVSFQAYLGINDDILVFREVNNDIWLTAAAVFGFQADLDFVFAALAQP